MTSAKKLIAVGVLAAGALAMSGVAQARDNVYWSVGVGGPGLVMGASNVPPIYVAPAPVYVAPQPVYVRPRPVYVAPPSYYEGVPVVYPRYRHWRRWGDHWEHRQWRHEHDDDDD